MIRTSNRPNRHVFTAVFFSRFLKQYALIAALAVVFLLTGFGTWCSASPTAPSARDKQVATAVAAFLSRAHLSRQGFDELDDEISERWINADRKSVV